MASITIADEVVAYILLISCPNVRFQSLQQAAYVLGLPAAPRRTQKMHAPGPITSIHPVIERRVQHLQPQGSRFVSAGDRKV